MPATWSMEWLREAGKPERIKELTEALLRTINNLIRDRTHTISQTQKITNSGAKFIEQELVAACEKFNFHNVSRSWGKAHKLVHTDPSAAITAASSLLETAFKYVLTKLRAEIPKDQNIGTLYLTVKKNIFPLLGNSDDHEKIRGLIKSLTSTVECIGGIRTQIGDAHGKGPLQRRGSTEEALLAVSAAGSVSTFLINQVG